MYNNDKCSSTGACDIKKDHIKGIKCDVKNCVYHDGESRCTAGEITVGPTYASTSGDTACATFKPNTESKSG